MSNAKFTPGPWRFNSTLNCISTTAENIRQDVICDVEGSMYKSLVKPENAHLIAAAPKMYEALSYLNENGEMPLGTTIDDLLAEARGES